MPTEMTYEAAIIELNRLKSQERMDIDRERMTAAIDKLIGAARYQIKQKPIQVKSIVKGYQTEFRCPSCGELVYLIDDKETPFTKFSYCLSCGQAIDWDN